MSLHKFIVKTSKFGFSAFYSFEKINITQNIEPNQAPLTYKGEMSSFLSPMKVMPHWLQ